MEETEVCSLPGGLASVRKQFETRETATSHNVTQFHFHHRTVQEMSNSEGTTSSSSRQLVQGSQQQSLSQEATVSYSHSNFTSSCDHQDETEEELPRFTTKELRDRFEKTIGEAAAHKPIKVRVPKSELCTVCRRRAYPMDAVIVDKRKYHKSCFCCEHCGNKLSLGNCVSLHGHFYCLHHYKQLLKSKGSFDNGLGQNPPAGSSGSIPSDEKLDWRYSTSSPNSLDKTHSAENNATKAFDESKPHCNKISVVWPPQADPLKKAFKIEDDIQLTKPQWPPLDNTPKSPKQQHRKAVRKSVLCNEITTIN